MKRARLKNDFLKSSLADRVTSPSNQSTLINLNCQHSTLEVRLCKPFDLSAGICGNSK